MPTPRRNLELKAADPEPRKSLRTCEELGAEDKGRLIQKDTYFAVGHGRLKLREEEGGTAQLISYVRPDLAGQRQSDYEIVEVPEPDGLGRVLAGALGIVTVVRKTRRLFLFEGVRIHLDQVAGLGDFIEFEGVADQDERDLSRFDRLLLDLRASFGIHDGDLLAGSYCDLLLQKPTHGVP